MASSAGKKKGIKPLAAKMIRGLAEDASWDDLMYQIYVHQKIETGLADLQAGRTQTHSVIKKEFGLMP